MNADRLTLRSIRVKKYDYSQLGAYFITICSKNRGCIFGNIAENEMHLNDFGNLVTGVWDNLPSHYQQISLDAFVVMPNHIHGVVVIDAVGAGPRPARFGLPEIVRVFKSFTTREIDKASNNPGVSVWQRNPRRT